MQKEKLTKLINTCYEAVNESRVGPVFVSVKGEVVPTQIGFGTYFTLLSNLCPNVVQAMDPPEKWRSHD